MSGGGDAEGEANCLCARWRPRGGGRWRAAGPGRRLRRKRWRGRRRGRLRRRVERRACRVRGGGGAGGEAYCLWARRLLRGGCCRRAVGAGRRLRRERRRGRLRGRLRRRVERRAGRVRGGGDAEGEAGRPPPKAVDVRWRRTPPAGGASDSSDGSGGVALTGAAPATPTARADGGVAAPERAWWPCDGCASCRRCWAVPEAVRAAKEAASPAREAVPGPVAGLATAVSKPDKRDARRASARRLYARSRWRAGGRDLRRGSRV